MTPPPNHPEQERFVLTGPTGWIGTAFLRWFRTEFGPTWATRVSLFGSSALTLGAPDGAEVKIRPLSELTPDDVDGAHVIHLAYLTKEKVSMMGEPAFFTTNRAIDDPVVAALEGGRARGVFISSSGAAKVASTGEGRELYGVCKLLQEDRFLGLAKSTGLKLWTGRIYNMAGPGINKIQSYALSSFLDQATSSGMIRISASTPVYRSYLHVLDLCELVVRSFRVGFSSEAPLDLCGCLTVEMADVAAAAARTVGLNGDWLQRPAVDSSQPSCYLGDPTIARTLALRLGVPLRPFQVQVDDTAHDLGARGIIRPLTGRGSHG